MQTWKKIVLWATGVGAGFAVMSAIIIGGVMWWSSRPPKAKPWNQSAITATYSSLGTEGDTNTFWFAYIVENHSDTDFSLSNDTGVHLAVMLKRSNNALSFDDSKTITVDYPIFIPARHSARIRVHLAYPYPKSDDVHASNDIRHDYETKVAMYLTSELNNVNGFVLMDDGSRYQINMPNGWDERAKEPLRVKDAK